MIEIQDTPSVAGLKDGGWVVTWISDKQDGSSYGIIQQRYNAAGQAVGGEIVVNSITEGHQAEPAVISLPDGGWVVTWTSNGDIHQQRFSAEGQKIGQTTPTGLVLIGQPVAEGAAISAPAGQLEVKALEQGGAYTFTLLDDADGRFALSASGAITVKDGVRLDYEQAQSHRIKVQVKNSLGDSYEQWVQIQVADVASESLTGTTTADMLRGGQFADMFKGSSGNDTLDGGSGADVMDGGLGDDTIYIDNAGDVVIEAAGQGGDRVYVNAAAYVLNAAAEVEVMVASAGALNLTGSDFANAITGNSLSNQLWGLSGNDQLTGDLGHDRLSGGLGNDIMTGGAGKDVFVFDTKLNKRSNVDRVEDFRYQDDSIYLENKIFTKLGSGTASKPKKFKADMFTTGTRAQDKEDRIVYDKKSGKLYYDQDGAGGKAQVQIATLSKNLKMTAADFFVI